MIVYADPGLCPACRAPLATYLQTYAESCPACALPLTHPLVGNLVASLRAADRIVARLHAVTVPVPSIPVGPAPYVEPDPERPATTRADDERVGVRTTSVAPVLLALGAGCLAFAAVAFLVVAWTWLGVGGRTSVLLALTGAAVVGTLATSSRGLRAAAETLTLLSGALVLVDVAGLALAGWLGGWTVPDEALLTGVLLAGLGLTLSAAARELVVAQLVAVLGVAVVVESLVGRFHSETVVPAVAVPVVLALAATTLGRRPVLSGTAALTAVLLWTQLAAFALATTQDLRTVSWASLWTGAAPGRTLLVVALETALPALPWLVRRSEGLRTTAVISLVVAVTLLTILVAAPGFDEGGTVVTEVGLAVAVLGAVVALALPRPWTPVTLVPAGLAAVPLALVELALAGHALQRLLTPGPGLRLTVDAGTVASGLVVPVALGLLLVVAAVDRASSDEPAPARTWLLAGTASLPVLAIITVALHPVPLWSVVAAIEVVGALLAVAAVRTPGRFGTVLLVVALAPLSLAQLAAWPGPGLFVATAVVVTAIGAAALLRGYHDARLVGGPVLAVGLTLVVEGAARWTGTEVTWAGVVVLVATGALALVVPRVEVEATSLVLWLVAGGLTLDAAADPVTWLAGLLTLAGSLVVTTSLVHRSRRGAAVLGGLLLAAASWVRLAELGVHAPEAYTLPSAIVLLVVGVVRLRREPALSTSVALLPGLGLGLTPSLLWVLATGPVSARAALLGLACLAAVLTGAACRWSAPLVAGATSGAVLVAFELAPCASTVPQWLLLGVAGALLLTVGLTWERQVLRARAAAGFVGRLR